MRRFAVVLVAALLAFIVACTTQPAALPSQFQAHRTTMTLEFADGICSGTAIGPHAILTATHCFAGGGALVKAGGKAVKVVKQADDEVTVAMSLTDDFDFPAAPPRFRRASSMR